MSTKYSSYHNIEKQYVDLFESLYEKYAHKIPQLPTSIQNKDNVKAAVFNYWVNIYPVKKYLVIKQEKFFLHAYDDLLVKRFNLFMPENVKEIVNHHRSNEDFSFLYSYFIVLNVLEALNTFVVQHEKLNSQLLHKYNYYYLTDDDVPSNDPLYIIMKILTAEFIQSHLTEQKCVSIHLKSLNKVSISFNLIEDIKSSNGS